MMKHHLPRMMALPTLGGLAMAAAALTPAVAAPAPADRPAIEPVAYVAPEFQRGQVIEPIPYVLPVTGYRLTGRFGNAGSLWSSDHTGLDFAAAYGTAISSITAGTVVSVEYDGAYGLKTVVVTDDGTELWYCHQDAAVVSVGDTVQAGDQIGTIGTSGNTTGPHLHLEVRPHGGDPVDPEVALADWGVRP